MMPVMAALMIQHILFAGDSLTDGSAWSDWVVETLRANGHSRLVKSDAGIAGNKVADLRARFQHDVVDLKPDTVVFNIGTNDRKSTDEYRQDMEAMVKPLRASGTRVVLCTPPGINDPKKPELDAKMVAYGEVLRDLAKTYDCTIVDFHTAFAGGTRATNVAEQTAVSIAAEPSRVLWGPDGVHHTMNGWRTMGRCVLDALDCRAPMIEKVVLAPGMLTDWQVGPAMPWKAGEPYPALPENFTGWRKFDREAEVAKTTWWQRSWLERGGVMPMGQEVVAGKPGTAGKDAGAFALAIVKSDKDTEEVLHLGGSPGYAVWWNGELIWQCKTLRGYHPDAERITVKLRKGENRILVFTNWLFYVSLGEI